MNICAILFIKDIRVPLPYDLTTFQILGKKFVKFFVGILVQIMTPKGHFEINWHLASNFTIEQTFHSQAMNYEKYWKEAAQNAI